MIINNENKHILKESCKLGLHDFTFLGHTFDYDSKTLEFLISNCNKHYFTIKFLNTLGFKSQICDSWGSSPRINGWSASESEYFKEIKKLAGPAFDIFEVELELTSGNYLTVVCDMIVFDETDEDKAILDKTSAISYSKIVFENNFIDRISIKKDLISDEEYIKTINENFIYSVCIDEISRINILKSCTNVKHLEIILPSDCDTKIIDFSALYAPKELNYLKISKNFSVRYNPSYMDSILDVPLDLSKVSNLVDLSLSFIDVNHISFRNNKLKRIELNHCGKELHTLDELYLSNNLEQLSLSYCDIKSLVGIENSKNISTLLLEELNALEDIGNLKFLKNKLKRLVIQNCIRIKDFSVIGELKELEFLELYGENEIPDLHFIKQMKKLQSFRCSLNVKN